MQRDLVGVGWHALQDQLCLYSLFPLRPDAFFLLWESLNYVQVKGIHNCVSVLRRQRKEKEDAQWEVGKLCSEKPWEKKAQQISQISSTWCKNKHWHAVPWCVFVVKAGSPSGSHLLSNTILTTRIATAGSMWSGHGTESLWASFSVTHCGTRSTSVTTWKVGVWGWLAVGG